MHSCVTPEPEIKDLSYKNIIILADMSSRIRNPLFPPKDTEEIEKLTAFFRNECVKPGEKIGDRSSISFLALSQKDRLEIDLEDIQSISERQSFINSTGNFDRNGLDKKLEEFNEKVNHYYETVVDKGLDLISVMDEKIRNENLVKRNKQITDGMNITNISYDNDIYLFTDAYLEYVLSQKRINSQYYFGADEIEKIRQYCNKNKVNVTTALQDAPSLRLPSLHNDLNQYINLIVMETHERDKNLTFQTYNHPSGQRDNEILEAVWELWAKESGFKSFKWKKY